MDWQYLYRDRIRTADEAVQRINSRMRVFVSGMCAAPQTLLNALIARAPQLTDVELFQVLAIGPGPHVAPELAEHLRLNTPFISDTTRTAVNDGRADFTPVFLSEIPRLFKSGRLRLDVALVHVSPPDEHGFCSFGVEVGLSKPCTERARCVIAEVNPRMPRTWGDTCIHISRLDVIVPVDYPIPEVNMASTDPLADHIADHIAAVVPDGATLQLGIGAIPDAVLRRLHGHRDLGIHTEMFSDGVLDLVERGVITGEKKTLHRGKIVCGFLIGTQRLYDFVDDNPLLEMHPQDYVNDPRVIAQNDRQVAINSAIEVDLTGQVCADSIGPRLYSGVGGQVDFIYGSSRSKGGLPIIALPSSLTLRDGTRLSRIVPALKCGAGVVTSNSHVHYVATEYGIADLFGKTIPQRARALIDIAAPEFRADLEKAARELGFLYDR